jgi:hypothetical protein
MRKSIVISFTLLTVLVTSSITKANGDGFGDVVKLIEQFYHVKHQGIPFLANAGISTARTIARVSGGRRRQVAEAGSAKVAFFEDQDFKSSNGYAPFRNSMNSVLAGWSPLIQVTSPKDDEQTYIYLREATEKFNVIVVTIERHEAYVVQVTLSPENLAKLMRAPDEMGETLTVEATMNDDKE